MTATQFLGNVAAASLGIAALAILFYGGRVTPVSNPMFSAPSALQREAQALNLTVGGSVDTGGRTDGPDQPPAPAPTPVKPPKPVKPCGVKPFPPCGPPHQTERPAALGGPGADTGEQQPDSWSYVTEPPRSTTHAAAA